MKKGNSKSENAHVIISVKETLLIHILGRFSKLKTDNTEKALGKDWVRLPVLNLPLCRWSSQVKPGYQFACAVATVVALPLLTTPIASLPGLETIPH